MAFIESNLSESKNSLFSKKITKNDLVDSIYQDTGYERQLVQKVVESFLEQVKDSLSSGCTIELRGFGTFEPRLRKGRSKARNPKTGETLSVEPHYVAVFRAGKELKNNLFSMPVADNE